MPGWFRMRRYDERGVAVSTPIALLSLAAVVLTGMAFASTSAPSEPPTARQVTATPSPTVAPSREATPTLKKKPTKPAKPKKPPIRRGDVYVEVYNNSGISGLAGATAETISGAGWQVVGSDNWYGTIPASTVYYPDRLEREAKALARDLGIERLRSAVAPMRFDRLTVILTADYA